MQDGATAKTELKSELKSCLEQILYTYAYPKQIFNFQITVLTAVSSQTFAACLNACIALLNQTAICQKEAPCAAVTLALASGDNEDDMHVTTSSVKDEHRADSLIDTVVALESPNSS